MRHVTRSNVPSNYSMKSACYTMSCSLVRWLLYKSRASTTLTRSYGLDVDF